MLQVVSPADVANSQLGVVAAQAGGAAVAGYGAPANKLQRSDRIEVSFQFSLIPSSVFVSVLVPASYFPPIVTVDRTVYDKAQSKQRTDALE